MFLMIVVNKKRHPVGTKCHFYQMEGNDINDRNEYRNVKK
jgi:hypothetical protein